MHTAVLLLDEGTALAFVGVVAILAVCLLALSLVVLVFFFVNRRERSSAAAAEPGSASRERPVFYALPEAPAARATGSRKRAVPVAVKNLEIDVPTRHADALIHALLASGWQVRDTGEVVATDEDEEGLTTISVDVPGDSPRGLRPSSGEEVQ